MLQREQGGGGDLTLPVQALASIRAGFETLKNYAFPPIVPEAEEAPEPDADTLAACRRQPRPSVGELLSLVQATREFSMGVPINLITGAFGKALRRLMATLY